MKLSPRMVKTLPEDKKKKSNLAIKILFRRYPALHLFQCKQGTVHTVRLIHRCCLWKLSIPNRSFWINTFRLFIQTTPLLVCLLNWNWITGEQTFLFTSFEGINPVVPCPEMQWTRSKKAGARNLSLQRVWLAEGPTGLHSQERHGGGEGGGVWVWIVRFSTTQPPHTANDAFT